MKKTNVALLRMTRKVGMFLSLLAFAFFVSSSSLVAQDFLSLADAYEAVDEALTDLRSEADLVNADTQSDATDKRLRTTLYTEFLAELKGNQSVPAAYNEVRDLLSVDELEQPRKEKAERALEDLLDLITD